METIDIKQLGLPTKFDSWRNEQAEIVEDIAKSPEKFYLLDAPTGTGKSLIGIASYRRKVILDELLARLHGEDKLFRCIYLTKTIQLQEQVLHDFPFAKMVKGRSNYICNLNPKLTADDCPGDCGNFCSYKVAKRAAAAAPLVVLNYSYYLTEVSGPGMFSGADMVILDEVDCLEEAMLGIVSFSISELQCKHYKITPPSLEIEKIELRTWLTWFNTIGRRLQAHIDKLKNQLPEQVNLWGTGEIAISKDAKQAASFLHRLEVFLSMVTDSWIMTYEVKPKAGWVVTFKPVIVSPFTEQYIWGNAKKFLGMSGTILDPEVLVEDLGMYNWKYQSIESNFPVYNRFVRYNPVADLKYAKMDEELPKLVDEVVKIINKYPEENILVHATSNKIRDYLMNNLPSKNINSTRLLTHDTSNRADKLNQFKKSRGVVMISPSFDRGVDLPDDECRVVVICKVPYLGLGDKQVKARLAMPMGQRWYNLRAIQTLMQMTGRAVRSKDDFSDIYILDKSFNSLIARTRRIIPKWWIESIKS
jgi:Rad3-related DNA helicase